MSKPSVNKPGTRRRRAALTTSASALLTTVAIGYAIAAPPPANQRIGNKAVATYVDQDGQNRQTLSNEVSTIVQQVGNFKLDGDNDQPAIAGGTVYLQHTLTNTGNGSDTFRIIVDEDDPAAPLFDRVQIFVDAAPSDGKPDDTNALCDSKDAAKPCTTGITQLVAGNNGTFKFVVAYTLPNTATPANWPLNRARVTASPVPSTVPYTTATDSDVDTLRLTTVEAFSMTKSISTPSVAAPGGGAWPAISSSGPVSAATGCAVSWTPGLTSNATCTYVPYTLRYRNQGGAAGSLSFRDQLPAGYQYVSGSAVWSSAPGTALGDAIGAGNDPTGINYEYDSATSTIRATITNVPLSSEGTVTFVALVKNTAAIGTSTTTNVAYYSNLTCSDPNTCASTPTNASEFTVLGTYKVVAANVASTTPDAVEDNPAKSGIDIVTQPQVVAGASVPFTVVISNNGNAVDAYDLTVSNSNFPTGTTFTYWQADGVSPLLNNTGGPAEDTGDVAPGTTKTIVVKANVPASAIVGSGPFEVLLTATSTKATAASNTTDDSVWLTVTRVVGAYVDLTNSLAGTGSGAVADGDKGPGPSPQPTTVLATDPGKSVLFPLFVRNNDAGTDLTFTLEASQTATFPGTLPPGWKVTFHASGGTCTSAAITSIAVPRSDVRDVVACVSVPSNAQATATTPQPVYFRVRSTANASGGSPTQDIKLDGVTVNAVADARVALISDGAKPIAVGSTVQYVHTLTNVGNLSCGAFNVTVDMSAADRAAGWAATLYIDRDNDGDIDASDETTPFDTANETLPVLATNGASRLMMLRVIAPTNVVVGAVNVAKLTVTDTRTTGLFCPAVSNTDTSTVIAGHVDVTKWQIADPGCNTTSVPTASNTGNLSVRPGQCIVYEITATNRGADPVRNVMISDPVPVFTTYHATQPVNPCTASGFTPGSPVLTAPTPAAPTVMCGSTTNTLAPGGFVKLRFRVQIDQ